MNSRLIEDDVRELGEIVYSVLDPATSHDAVRLLLVRLPEGGFIDVIRFLKDSFAEAICFEHFDASDLKAIGLA